MNLTWLTQSFISTLGDVVTQGLPQDRGIKDFLMQSDTVGRTLFAVLLIMAFITWVIIFAKGITNYIRRKKSQAFLDDFWKSPSLDKVYDDIQKNGSSESFSRLALHAIKAKRAYEHIDQEKTLEQASGSDEFVMRNMRKILDLETTGLENGLVFLGSIGSTAPFVGLFGTVWGVYHALIGIGMSDGISINQVAGPVGEALIMTGFGLAVAIPAVLAYNFFVRRNRKYLTQLDAFAHDLFTNVTTGYHVKKPEAE